MNLGGRLRRLRRNTGLSQKALQRRSGLQASYLSKVEHDVVLPGVKNLNRIARALGSTLAELFATRSSRPRRKLLPQSSRRK